MHLNSKVNQSTKKGSMNLKETRTSIFDDGILSDDQNEIENNIKDEGPKEELIAG